MNEQNRPQVTPGMSPEPGGFSEGAAMPNGPKKSSGKKVAVIIVVIVALFAVVFGAVYALAFGNKIKDPEEYLNDAFANNQRAKNALAANYPNISKFEGNSIQSDLYLGSDMLGFDIDFSYIMNRENNSLWASLDFDVQGLSFDGNEIYLSNDMVGLKIPFLFPQVDFITVDTHTIVNDWNSSEWGQFYPIYLSQQEVDDSMAALDNAYGNTDITGLTDTMAQLAENVVTELENNRTIRGSAVKKDLTLNNTTYKTNEFVYIYPASSMQSAFDSFMVDYWDVVDAWIELAEQSDSMTVSDIDEFYNALNILDAELANIAFPEDLLVHAYVDENQYVRKMSFEGLKMEYPEGGQTKHSLIDFDFSLLGANNPYEEYQIDIYIHEITPTEISIHGTKNNSSGVTDETLSFILSSSPDTLQVDYNYYWDEYETADTNFNMGVKFQMNRDALNIGIEGILEDTANGITISNGILTIGASGVRIPVNFSLTSVIADNPSTDISGRNNTSFFRISPNEILDAFSMFY